MWQLFQFLKLYSDTKTNNPEKNSPKNKDNVHLSFRKAASLVLIMCIIFSGCATVKFDKAEVLPASSYKYSCSKSGLTISVDPFIDEDRVNRIFGYDLLSQGILPVLVIFENKNAEDGFILLKERSILLIKDHERQSIKDNLSGNIQTSDEMNKSANGEMDFVTAATASVAAGQLAAAAGQVSLSAGSALGAVGVVVIAIPAVIIATHQQNLSHIQQNIIDNELVNKPLYPGGCHSGFLYLKPDKKENIKHIEGVILNIKNIRSNEIQSIRIEMK